MRFSSLVYLSRIRKGPKPYDVDEVARLILRRAADHLCFRNSWDPGTAEAIDLLDTLRELINKN